MLRLVQEVYGKELDGVYHQLHSMEQHNASLVLENNEIKIQLKQRLQGTQARYYHP